MIIKNIKIINKKKVWKKFVQIIISAKTASKLNQRRM